MIPHLPRDHYKYPNLSTLKKKNHNYIILCVYYYLLLLLLFQSHHGCHRPVSGVIKHVQVLTLQISHDGGQKDHRNPDHEQSVVGRTHDGDLNEHISSFITTKMSNTVSSSW